MKKSFLKSAMVWLLIMLAFISALAFFETENPKKSKISYTEMITEIEKNNLKNITVDIETSNATGEYKDGKTFTANIGSMQTFQAYVNEFNSKQSISSRIAVEFIPPTKFPVWVSAVPNILMLVMLGVVWFIFIQQSQGGGGGKGVMNFGKSRAKLAVTDKNKTTFNDVAGADEEKEELKEVVDFLKQPRRYIEIGARIPKGLLLIGPPGTGKTLLARAVAGEAGVPFFSISGSDFVEMFVGVGASRVRDLFETAKKNAPCIVFVDEIDAVGRQRGAGLGGGHDEREQTLNQLLVEMDGFGTNEGIIMIAATNRPDILDSALLRPGRFDRQILVNVPDVKGREEILKVHSKNKPLDASVDLSVVARRTPGFTGADLENLMNEAAILTVRRGKKYVGRDEIEESATRVMAGPEKKSRIISERERKLTAFHEAGHAVITRLLPNADPVHQVSIIPRGRAGGYTLSLPQEDKYFSSKTELEDQIVILLGGRVSEKLVLNDISTGASNDIERATNIARKMVTAYGMSDKLGPIEFGGHEEVFIGRDFSKSRNYSEEVAALIDSEIRDLVETAYKRAESILNGNMNKLNKIASALLERETLNAEEFEAVFSELE